MAPFLDYANHSADSALTPEYDLDGGMTLVALQPYQAGEQIFINYGARCPSASPFFSTARLVPLHTGHHRSNIGMWIHYGFVPVDNPLHTVRIPLAPKDIPAGVFSVPFSVVPADVPGVLAMAICCSEKVEVLQELFLPMEEHISASFAFVSLETSPVAFASVICLPLDRLVHLLQSCQNSDSEGEMALSVFRSDDKVAAFVQVQPCFGVVFVWTLFFAVPPFSATPPVSLPISLLSLSFAGLLRLWMQTTCC